MRFRVLCNFLHHYPVTLLVPLQAVFVFTGDQRRQGLTANCCGAALAILFVIVIGPQVGLVLLWAHSSLVSCCYATVHPAKKKKKKSSKRVFFPTMPCPRY